MKPAAGNANDAPADAERAPRPLVLGTAGHIDHGKTSLVRALTGQDLDRLPEEKARGITIELGFAPLELEPGLRVALVDVPGHERFVRTMVAGASGLDLVLLVVAADEGVMPQTREHVAICALLGVERGLVVLTKADLVDEEMLELATEDVRDALADGPLAAAPVIPASAETGLGLDEVRETLIRLVRETPDRGHDLRPARLAVDRTFTQRGFGAVVTGTWSGRALAVGDEVQLEPDARRARIRGLERHGEAVDQAAAGARIAVNLQGIATDEITRGDVLTEPGRLRTTTVFDVELRWLGRAALEEAASVELLSGTTERRARIALIGDVPIAAGESGFARVHVEDAPLALLPEDRFVVRGFARDAGVGATLGGGRVLDIAPPHRRRRDPDLLAELRAFARDDGSEGLRLRIVRAGLSGARTESLALETGIAPERLRARLEALDASGAIRCLEGGVCVGTDVVERLESMLLETLEGHHADAPLLDGMPRSALAGTLPENVSRSTGSALIEHLSQRGLITVRGETVALSGFVPHLEPEEEALAQTLSRRLSEAALDAPALRSVADELGEPEARLRALAHFLERQGTLVAAPDDLFFDRGAVIALIDRVVAHFDVNDQLDTQAFKALIGTSRRTAMPLMALIDDLQVTRRDGSVRRMLSREPRW